MTIGIAGDSPGVGISGTGPGGTDGASGTGTSANITYNWNSGGPLLSTGSPSTSQFDRTRTLQGKGLASAGSVGAAAGATALVATIATATNSLVAGAQIRIDRNTPIEEVNYVAAGYTPGTASITLVNGLQFTHGACVIEWDVFSPSGPGLNGFTPAGIALSAGVQFDPVTGNYFVARSATQDGVPALSVMMESQGLLNSSGRFDRQIGSSGRVVTTSYEILATILIELRTISQLLVEGLNIRSDPDDWRNDPSLDTTMPGSVT